jgi:chemotaxis protein methyltransferase CheR
MIPAADVDAIEVRLLLEAIRARYGYDFLGYARPSMERRVRAALLHSGCAHLGELQHKLLTEPQVFHRVVEDLTLKVSSLFRDPAQFLFLREQVFGMLKTWPQLKVWHAGCAGGEEVYSFAMLLTEAGLLERTQLYATDLSPRALAHAREGLFALERLDEAEASFRAAGGRGSLSDHSTFAWGGLAIHEALKRNVFFFQHDLGTDHPFAQCHVIFCRNVLIYFGSELRERALQRIEDSLAPGGFLCLGSSERLAPGELGGHFVELDATQRVYRYTGVRT